MATKIRLQRHGRKGYAYYHIVVSDSRAPRDGKFIERLGAYNPNTNPATIDLNFERALYWIQVGAQPTDTTRNILSREGVMMKKHLLGGVQKGAFSLEEAETKFEAWKQGKDSSLNAVRVSVKDAERADNKNRLEVETTLNKAKADEIAKKQAAAKAKESATVEEAPVEPVVEVVPAAEAPVEPVVETVPAADEPVIPVVDNAPAADEPIIPVVDTTPAAEAPVEPVVEAVPAADEPIIPVVDTTPAADEPIIPVVDTTPAAEKPVEPVVETVPAADEPIIPVVNTTPAAEKPVEPVAK